MWYNLPMEEREIARKLRAQGKTFHDIQVTLGRKISKGTLSYWLKDIKLSAAYMKKYKINVLASLKRGRINSLKKRKLIQNQRANEIQLRCENIISNLDAPTLKIALAFLYLGEGYKWKSHRGLQLGSSSTELIQLYIILLERCYNVARQDLRAYVGHRADQNLLTLQKYWSKALKIPLSHFYKSKPDPRTVGKKTLNKDYHGVCTISCAGTDKQLELEALPRVILSKLH